MKKLLFILLLLPAVTFAQLKVVDLPKENIVGEYKRFGTVFEKLTLKDSTYAMFYRDDTYSQIDAYKVFYFKAADLNTVYNLFYDSSLGEQGSEKMIDLDNGDKLYFKYKTMLGKKYVEVLHQSAAGPIGKLTYMSKSQTAKVFGK